MHTNVLYTPSMIMRLTLKSSMYPALCREPGISNCGWREEQEGLDGELAGPQQGLMGPWGSWFQGVGIRG